MIVTRYHEVHRVLFDESMTRIRSGRPAAEIRTFLAAAATAAFDLLEPSLGTYGRRR